MPKYDSITDIVDILDEYSSDVQEGISNAAQTLANQAANELKATNNTYKIRTGKYNKGWRVNTQKGRGVINCTVHNATNWQLTHLLENGHITRNGGRTRAFVHIKPVEDKYVNQYTKDVENIIKNLNKPKNEPAKPKEKSLELKDFESKIKRILSTSVAIKGNDNKGKIVIDYYSLDDLNRIYDVLMSIQK